MSTIVLMGGWRETRTLKDREIIIRGNKKIHLVLKSFTHSMYYFTSSMNYFTDLMHYFTHVRHCFAYLMHYLYI